jgi:hypothetical protein
MIYVEDLFVKFHNTITVCDGCSDQDYAPIFSFYDKITSGEELTQNQGNFILKLLEKYKHVSAAAGFDYNSTLSSATWKTPFRLLDLSKRISVDKDSTGKVWVQMKFPYQMKKQFEEEITYHNTNQNSGSWDPENKIRKLSLYDNNLIHLYEFAQKYNFEIDDTFMLALAEVEEIWQNVDNILPCCRIVDGKVELINPLGDAVEWWKGRVVNSVADNLLTAKSMGYSLKGIPSTLLEKIAVAKENQFWVKTNQELFSLYKEITGTVCIVLDRSSDTMKWLQQFVADADANTIPRSDIKVCFRENKDGTQGLNDWIKQAGVGGKVETGRILIFESKPAKWLFKDDLDVKMLITNNIYPPTNVLTAEWFKSHPCTIYLGNIKPSEKRGNKIVEL